MICFRAAVIVYYWNELINHPLPLCEECRKMLQLPMPGVQHMIRPPAEGEVCDSEMIFRERMVA